jgi:hypothetical protein
MEDVAKDDKPVAKEEDPKRTSHAPDKPKEEEGKKYELTFGLTLSICAALLAINELASGKYGDDELKMTTEKTSHYLWYQSKGIKESLLEGHRDTLKALARSGAIEAGYRGELEKEIQGLEKNIARYGKEKKEILLGSKGVGQANWSLDIDGVKGKVVGVKDMEKELEMLSVAGDRFDIATLFLQLSLVFGAIGIITSRIKIKRAFLGVMIVGGLIGAVWSSAGFMKVGIF